MRASGFEKPLLSYRFLLYLSRVFRYAVTEFEVDNRNNSRYNVPMKNQITDAISCSLRGFRLPRYQEIPDVGLYLEQTTKYVNQCIAPLGFEAVTSSMIRNYVKQGLIANPIQKQYSANHIAHLIALVLLKQVTQLDYVSNLFQLLNAAEEYTDQIAYDYFCEELENILYFRFGLKERIDDVGVTSSLEKEMLRSAVTAVSHIVYLNRCFQVISPENK